MKKKTKKYIYAVVGLAILIGGIYYWRAKQGETDQQIQYETAAAEKGTLTISVSGSGNVVVDQLATVDPTISGTVTNLAVQVGDSVSKGQFLFDIVNDQLGVSVTKSAASLEQAKNAVETAEIQEDQAEEDLEAAEKKDKADPTAFSKGQLEILEDKIDTAENAVEIAKKNLEAALADHRDQQSKAAERKVTAPISGTVNEVNIKNGDDLGKISSGTTTKQSPMIIGDLGTLKASISVNEVDISRVSIGQKVMLKFDALDSLEVSGRVEKIDALGTINQGVVTYNVIVNLDTLDSRIKPEMSVSASIITDVVSNAIIVPSGSVKNEGGENYVEVLKGSVPERKTVTVGAANNTQTEIKSGLIEGDQVVTQTIDPNASPRSSTTQGGGAFRLGGGSGR